MHLPNKLKSKARLTAVICAMVIGNFGLWTASAATASASQGTPTSIGDLKPVRLSTKREGEVTHFLVENKELCEITMTFEMNLLNLKGTVGFPCTLTFPPQQTTEAFSVSPQNPSEKWEYSYTNFYKLGSHLAKHNDSYVYQLPYAAGQTFRVTQGYNGSFSHVGSNKYAIDWKMPEGTAVYAARGGTVVKVKDDSDTGGANIKYDPYNNFVLIRQEDGTLAHYCHLQKGGCCVRPGQTVQAGEMLAHSGNTGFSSGAHLHFCVFKTKDGRERESIPVKFKTSEEKAITLRTGKNYKAGSILSAKASLSVAPELSPRGGTVQ